MRLTTVRVRPARKDKAQELGANITDTRNFVEVTYMGDTIAFVWISPNQGGPLGGYEVKWLHENWDRERVLNLVKAYKALLVTAPEGALA